MSWNITNLIYLTHFRPPNFFNSFTDDNDIQLIRPQPSRFNGDWFRSSVGWGRLQSFKLDGKLKAYKDIKNAFIDVAGCKWWIMGWLRTQCCILLVDRLALSSVIYSKWFSDNSQDLLDTITTSYSLLFSLWIILFLLFNPMYPCLPPYSVSVGP